MIKLLSLIVLLSGIYITNYFDHWDLLQLHSKHGWKLFGLVGGHIPPFFQNEVYLNETLYREIVRDGDVICSVGAKMGTHLTLTLLHGIRTINNPELRDFTQIAEKQFGDIAYVAPWLDFKLHPKEQIYERVDTILNQWPKKMWDNENYKFRLFKSHLGPQPAKKNSNGISGYEYSIPVEQFPKIKHIVVVRNGLDVIESFFHFFKNFNPEFKKLWGGFPPEFADMDECFDFFLPEPLANRHFAKAWYEFRNNENVLLLHYKNIQTDFRNQVDKIIKFVGIKQNLTEKDYHDLENYIDIKSMKKRSKQYRTRFQYKNQWIQMVTENESGLLRKGEFRTKQKTEKVFTEDQISKYTKQMQEILNHDAEMIQFLEFGGKLPK